MPKLQATDEAKEVVKLLSEGKTTAQVAEAIGKNQRTFEKDMLFLKAKYSAKTIGGLVGTFLRAKLIK